VIRVHLWLKSYLPSSHKRSHLLTLPLNPV